jgi:hemoglobin-like flavoprotein
VKGIFLWGDFMDKLKLLKINLQLFDGDSAKSTSDGGGGDQKVFAADISLDFSKAIAEAEKFQNAISAISKTVSSLSNAFKDDTTKDFKRNVTGNILERYEQAAKSLKSLNISKATDKQIGAILTEKISTALVKNLAERKINLIGKKALDIKIELGKDNIEKLKQNIVGGLIESLVFPKKSTTFKLGKEEQDKIQAKLNTFITNGIAKGITFKDSEGENLKKFQLNLSQEQTKRVFNALEKKVSEILSGQIDFKADPNTPIGLETLKEIGGKISTELNKFPPFINAFYNMVAQNVTSASGSLTDIPGVKEAIEKFKKETGNFVKMVDEDVSSMSRSLYLKIMNNVKTSIEAGGQKFDISSELIDLRKGIAQEVKSLFPKIGRGELESFTQTGKTDVLKDTIEKKIESTQKYIDTIMKQMGEPDKKASDIKGLKYKGDQTVSQLLESKQKELMDLASAFRKVDGGSGDKFEFQGLKTFQLVKDSFKAMIDRFNESVRGSLENIKFDDQQETMANILNGLLSTYTSILEMFKGLFVEANQIQEKFNQTEESKEQMSNLIKKLAGIAETINSMNQNLGELPKTLSNVKQSINLLGQNFDKVSNILKEAYSIKEKGLDKNVLKFKERIHELGVNFGKLTGEMGGILKNLGGIKTDGLSTQDLGQGSLQTFKDKISNELFKGFEDVANSFEGIDVSRITSAVQNVQKQINDFANRLNNVFGKTQSTKEGSYSLKQMKGKKFTGDLSFLKKEESGGLFDGLFESFKEMDAMLKGFGKGNIKSSLGLINQVLNNLGQNFKSLESQLRKAYEIKERGLDKTIPLFVQRINEIGVNFGKLISNLKNIDISGAAPHIEKALTDFFKTVQFEVKGDTKLSNEIKTLSKKLVKVVGLNAIRQLDTFIKETTKPVELPGVADLKKQINEKIGSKITALAPSLLSSINNVFKGLQVPEMDIQKSFDIEVSKLNKDTKQRISKLMGFASVDEFVKANPIVKGFEMVKLLGEQRLNALNMKFYNTFDEKMAKSTKETMAEVTKLSLKPDLSALSTIEDGMVRLQRTVIQKVKKMIEEQFNVLVTDIRNMKIIPASIGNLKADRQMPIIPALKSNNRSVSDSPLLPMDDMFRPIAPVITGIPGVSKGVINPSYGNRYDTSTQNFAGAIKNTLRYILSNRLFMLPMQAVTSAQRATVDLDYSMEKARQNLLAKYPSNEVPFRSLAEKQIDSKLNNPEYKSIILKELKVTDKQFEALNLREKLIDKETRLFERQTRDGAKKFLQNLAINYGIPLSQVGEMWNIATRTYDNPFEAQQMIRASTRLYSSSPEELSPAETAKGMESIKSQWDLQIGELEKFSNMVMKTELSSQATVKDILDAQKGSGAVFRNFLPQDKYSKEEQFAISNALISLFIRGTGKSGSEAATMWRTAFAAPFTGEQARYLESLVAQTGLTKLSPYAYDELEPGKFTPTSKQKSGQEMFLDILDTYSDLKGNYPNIANDLIAKIFQRRYTASAMAISSVLETLPESKDGKTGFQQLVEQIMDTEGVDNYLWEVQTSSKRKAAKGAASWQVVGQEFGSMLKPEINALIDALSGMAFFIRDNSAILKELTRAVLNLGLTYAGVRYYEKNIKGKFNSALMNAELLNKVNPLVKANEGTLLAKQDALGQMDFTRNEIIKINNEKGLKLDVDDYLKESANTAELQDIFDKESTYLEDMTTKRKNLDFQKESLLTNVDRLENMSDEQIENDLKKRYKTWDKMSPDKKREIIEQEREDNLEKGMDLREKLSQIEDESLSDESIEEQKKRVLEAQLNLRDNKEKIAVYESLSGPFDGSIKELQEEYLKKHEIANARNQEIEGRAVEINEFNRAYGELGATKVYSPFGEVTDTQPQNTQSKDSQKGGSLEPVLRPPLPGNLASRVLGSKIIPRELNDYMKEKFDGRSFEDLDDYNSKEKEQIELEKKVNYLDSQEKYLGGLIQNEDALKASGYTIEELSSKLQEVTREKDTEKENLISVNEELEELTENVENFKKALHEFDPNDFKDTALKDTKFKSLEALREDFKLERVSSEGFIRQYNSMTEKSNDKISSSLNLLTSSVVGSRFLGRAGANRMGTLLTPGGLNAGIGVASAKLAPVLKMVPKLALAYGVASTLTDVAGGMMMGSHGRAMTEVQKLDKAIQSSQSINDWVKEGQGWWRKPVADALNIGRFIGGYLGDIPGSTRPGSKEILSSIQSGGNSGSGFTTGASLLGVAGTLLGPLGTLAGVGIGGFIGSSVESFLRRNKEEYDPYEELNFNQRKRDALKKQSDFEAQQMKRDYDNYINPDGTISRIPKDFDASLETMKDILNGLNKELRTYQSSSQRELEDRLFKMSLRARGTSEDTRNIMEEIWLRDLDEYNRQLDMTKYSMENLLASEKDEVARNIKRDSDEFQDLQQKVYDYESMIENTKKNLMSLTEIALADISRDIEMYDSMFQTELVTRKSNLLLRGFTENSNQVIDLYVDSINHTINQINSKLERREQEFYTDSPIKKLLIQEEEERFKENVSKLQEMFRRGIDQNDPVVKELQEMKVQNLEDISKLNGKTVDETEKYILENNGLMQDRQNALVDKFNMEFNRLNAIQSRADLDMGKIQTRASIELANLYKKGFSEETVAYRKIQENMMLNLNSSYKKLINETTAEIQRLIMNEGLEPDSMKVQEEQRRLLEYNAQIAENTRAIYDLWNRRGSFGLPDGIKEMSSYRYETQKNSETSQLVSKGNITMQVTFGDVYANDKQQVDDMINRLGRMINAAPALQQQFNGIRGGF